MHRPVRQAARLLPGVIGGGLGLVQVQFSSLGNAGMLKEFSSLICCHSEWVVGGVWSKDSL